MDKRGDQMNISSKLITLEKIVEENYFFKVPIYQRLYVWEDGQIRTLLEDLLTAYQSDKEIFYLGSVLVVEYDGDCKTEGCCFDLIDGQQRFTTLWMMSMIFSNIQNMYDNGLATFRYEYEKDRNYPRIEFSIRPKVNKFFSDFLERGESKIDIDERIGKALKLMQAFVNEQTQQDETFVLDDFMDFIFRKVQMVLTEVPAHTDLNKLFEVINNRGVQLQHHEILKAKMLKKLDKVDRDKYAILWDACSYMEQYIEKNIRDIAEIKISDLFDNNKSKVDEESVAYADKVLEKISIKHSEVLEESLTIEKILNESLTLNDPSYDLADEEYEADNVRSIISFPMLLEHTLRIWLAEKKYEDIPKILDKELLQIFNDHFFKHNVNEEDITYFIEILWEIRYIFDKYIIKWVSTGEEEHHIICKLRLNKSKNSLSLIRQHPQSNSGFSLLQSMLYHSQQITTHYWLTPLLSYIYENPGKNAYAYLRHLDNHLLCSSSDRPLIERTWEFINQPWVEKEIDSALLNEPLGVGFPHYWFYKLEFVLWYSKRKFINDKRWDDFRMTAKNSVEHISPQTRQIVDQDIVSESVLNTFGNLALVSRSINSEYGNKPYNEKRKHFENNNATKLDSLKMDMIYQHEDWNDILSKKHQKDMIELIEVYLADK